MSDRKGHWIDTGSGPGAVVPSPRPDVEDLACDAMREHPDHAEAIHGILAAYRAGKMTEHAARAYLLGARAEDEDCT